MVTGFFTRGLVSLAAAAAMAGAALAQEGGAPPFSADPFSALVGKRQPDAARLLEAKSVDRYVIATDDRVFLFQAGAREGRLKFLCGDGDSRMDCVIDDTTPAEEIHLVTPTRAPRGDTVWRDKSGEALLRIAAYGGATVFWPGDPRGHAASRSFGDDPALTLAFASLATARDRAQRATALISAQVGAPILFDVGDPGPDEAGGASVLADAVARAAKGVGRVANDPTGARIIGARVRRVEFIVGRPPAVNFGDGVLAVRYDPAALSAAPASAQSLKDLRAQERENRELSRQAAFTSTVCGRAISASIDWTSAADWPADESLAGVCDGALGAVETICRRGRTNVVTRFVCAGDGSGAELSGTTLRYGASPGGNGYAATLAEIGAAE